jgi:heavy metal sensor kinase
VSLSIRSRLTLWYAAVLSLVLAASAAALYVFYSGSRLARFDEELDRVDAQVERLMAAELGEGHDLPEAAHDALEDVASPDRPVAVFDTAGEHLAGSWEGLPRPTAGGRERATVATRAGAFRVRWARHAQPTATYLVGVAESLAAVERELAGLRRALLGTVALALALALAGGWWIARGALQPVASMAAQARRITDRTPGFRLASPNPADELGLLAEAFNELLTRLESALAQQRQFMADASHELRTPVSIARTAIDVSLTGRGRSEDTLDSLAVAAGQMRRLTRIVEDMFTLAHADATGLPVESRLLYLDELVAECVKETRVLASPKGVSLDWRGPADLEARGDERLLRRMLTNLLDNAIRHTPSGSAVRVDVVPQPNAVEVAVTDGGEGIPEGERDRIFQRFVRLNGSRRPGDGAGLGLPIARAIAEAHGGSLVLARSDASGSTFLARLPLS